MFKGFRKALYKFSALFTKRIKENTLTDRVHNLLFKISEENKKQIDQNLKIDQDLKNQIDSFINQTMAILLDPTIKTDKELVNKLNEFEIRKNTFVNSIPQMVVDFHNSEIKKLFAAFNSNSLEYTKTNSGNRFANQRGNILPKSFNINHKKKHELDFIATGNYEKGFASSTINLATKRILTPGQLVERSNQKTIVVGKNNKLPIESKYFKSRIVKHPSQNIFPLFEPENPEYREYCISEIMKIMSPDQHYKVRILPKNRTIRARRNWGMEINLIPNTKTLILAFSHLHRNGITNNEINQLLKNDKDYENLLMKPSKKQIDCFLNSIDQKSLVKTILISYFLGISDRINIGNTLFDQNGIAYSIDYTESLNVDHNERVTQSLEGIKNSNGTVDGQAIQLLKDDIIKTFGRENILKGMNDNDFILSIFRAALNNISDEEFMNILKDISSPDQIKKMQKIYNQNKDSYNKSGQYYNISKGLQDLGKAMSKAQNPSDNLVTSSISVRESKVTK